MKWYHYIAAFFAGAFLANFVPHFVKGVCGDLFPSPFSDPPGKGPSPPPVNVLWAGFNLIVGYLLLRAGKVSHQYKWSLVTFFIGAMLMALNLSVHFQEKMTGTMNA